MYLLHLLLCLDSLLHHSIQQVNASLSDLIHEIEEVQNMIRGLRNESRSLAIASISNVLKGEWSCEADTTVESIADTYKMADSSPGQSKVDDEPYGENVFQSPNAISWESVIFDWTLQDAIFLSNTEAVSAEGLFQSCIQEIPYNSHEIEYGVAHSPNDEYFHAPHYGSLGNKPDSICIPHDEGYESGPCLTDYSHGLSSNPWRSHNKGDNHDILQDQSSDKEVQTTCKAT